jgi:hypothetical protein
MMATAASRIFSYSASTSLVRISCVLILLKVSGGSELRLQLPLGHAQGILDTPPLQIEAELASYDDGKRVICIAEHVASAIVCHEHADERRRGFRAHHVAGDSKCLERRLKGAFLPICYFACTIPHTDNHRLSGAPALE